MRPLRIIGPVGYLAVHLEILILCSVLLGAFGIQFLEGELPCPLCILQRLGMMLAATGAAYILVKWKNGEIPARDYMTGHGMIIFAALGGAFVSIRQDLLHIMPDDPGYGDPVMGLHLYTWALVVFVCLIGSSAICLLFSGWFLEGRARPGWWSRAVLGLLAFFILANTVNIVIEQGFRFLLPDDPPRYQLLQDLGLKS
jgi:disulfide bond formation protein DsbB